MPFRRLPLLLSLLAGLAAGGVTTASASDVPGAELRLKSPLDYQVFQRSNAERGAIVIEGTWSVPRGSTDLPDAAEAFVTLPGAASQAAPLLQALPFRADVRGFRAELPLAAGGWYRVDVRLRRGATPVATVTVAHVGIGEVFVIAGQSNSANYGEERQRPVTGMVTAYDGEKWSIADDPQPGAGGTKGSFIPAFGDALATRLHVPVGVVCLGVGSTSVREWMPAGHPMSAAPTTGAHAIVLADGSIVSSGELFGRLSERLRAFPAKGVRAVLWHQGESDWKQPEGHNLPLDEYRQDLAELIAATRRTIGWNVPWFVAQVSYGNPSQPGSAEFRAQQLAVTDEKLTFAGPNTDTLTGALREKNGQGVHFSREGLTRHGTLWADIVGRWIERSGRGE